MRARARRDGERRPRSAPEWMGIEREPWSQRVREAEEAGEKKSRDGVLALSRMADGDGATGVTRKRRMARDAARRGPIEDPRPLERAARETGRERRPRSVAVSSIVALVERSREKRGWRRVGAAAWEALRGPGWSPQAAGQALGAPRGEEAAEREEGAWAEAEKEEERKRPRSAAMRLRTARSWSMELADEILKSGEEKEGGSTRAMQPPEGRSTGAIGGALRPLRGRCVLQRGFQPTKSGHERRIKF